MALLKPADHNRNLVLFHIAARKLLGVVCAWPRRRVSELLGRLHEVGSKDSEHSDRVAHRQLDCEGSEPSVAWMLRTFCMKVAP